MRRMLFGHRSSCHRGPGLRPDLVCFGTLAAALSSWKKGDALTMEHEFDGTE